MFDPTLMSCASTFFARCRDHHAQLRNANEARK
jgi:hypothetical protein